MFYFITKERKLGMFILSSSWFFFFSCGLSCIVVFVAALLVNSVENQDFSRECKSFLKKKFTELLKLKND